MNTYALKYVACNLDNILHLFPIRNITKLQSTNFRGFFPTNTEEIKLCLQNH